MKRFKLNRIVDVSNCSGTGIVAEGCLFSTGKVAISWLGKYKSTVWWDSIEDAELINCHGGCSKIEWVDED